MVEIYLYLYPFIYSFLAYIYLFTAYVIDVACSVRIIWENIARVLLYASL